MHHLQVFAINKSQYSNIDYFDCGDNAKIKIEKNRQETKILVKALIEHPKWRRLKSNSKQT